MKTLQRYKNGDTDVVLYSDGTREMDNHIDAPFHLEWPVSIDLNISNYCERGCPFCYQNCTREGKNADLQEIRRVLHPNMEVAININVGYEMDAEFVDFLRFCQNNDIVINVTINQDDLLLRKKEIIALQSRGLIHGVGISLTKIDKDRIDFFRDIENVVFHVIAGLVDVHDMELLNSNFPVLILGYKQKGRAENTELPDMFLLKEWLKNNIGFNENTLCFDYLSIGQLDIKSLLTDEEWNMMYQGDEGTISMYVDGVNMRFAVNSLAKDTYPIEGLTLQEMFSKIKEGNEER